MSRRHRQEVRYALRELRPAGFVVTLLRLHCPRCGRRNVCALEGTALTLRRQRRLLRPTGVSDWPALRCRTCENADLYLLEEL